MEVQRVGGVPPEGFRYWRNERADYLRRVGTVVIMGMTMISYYRFFYEEPVTAIYPALVGAAIGFTIGIADFFLERMPIPVEAPRNFRRRIHPVYGG